MDYIRRYPPDPETLPKTNSLHTLSLSVSLIDSQALSQVPLI